MQKDSKESSHGKEKDKEKQLLKGEILAAQAKAMTAMASQFGGETQEAYLRSKMDSEHRRALMFKQKERSLKLVDLFCFKDAGVYSTEEFAIESKKIMDSSVEYLF
jgi:hypothetical protein